MLAYCKSVYTGSIPVPASTTSCKSPKKKTFNNKILFAIFCTQFVHKISVQISIFRRQFIKTDAWRNLTESYGVEAIQIHKKLRQDKRTGSDNWYACLTLPNGKRLVKTTNFFLSKPSSMKGVHQCFAQHLLAKKERIFL